MSKDFRYQTVDFFCDPAASDLQKIAVTCFAIYGAYTISKQIFGACVPRQFLSDLHSRIPIINNLNFSFALPNAQQLVRMIPGVHSKFKQEVAQQVVDMIKPIVPYDKQLTKIPLKPVSPAALLEHCKDLQAHDVKPDGTAFAYVYETNDDEIQKAIDQVLHMFGNTNALSPLAFPSLRYMENCITSMCGHLLHLSPDFGSCGVLTSGGTESIICALKAHRDRAESLWNITTPELVAPITVHPAFTKGCHLLGIKCHLIPLHPNASDGVDMVAYAAAINRSTILLVGSAPAYPHGLIDPIVEICDLAKANKVPVHVDACIGGFFLPFVEMLQDKEQQRLNPIPSWDFRLPEVVSISLDLHKYGYTPKGASCIMYRDTELRKYQYYAQANWPGGLFVSPSLLGTRGGGSIAAAWATLQLYGIEGYKGITQQTLDAKKAFVRALSIHPDLEIIGDPISSIISFRVKPQYESELNILSIGDALELPKVAFKDGTNHEMAVKWKIERQQTPNSIHMTFMAKHIHTCDKFGADLNAAKRYVRENLNDMKGKGSTGMYGLVVNVSKISSKLIDEFLVEFESQIMSPDRSPEQLAAMGTKAKSQASSGRTKYRRAVDRARDNDLDDVPMPPTDGE